MSDPANVEELQDRILRELSRASMSADILVDLAPSSAFVAPIMESVIRHASARQLRLRCLLQVFPREESNYDSAPPYSGTYFEALTESGQWEARVAESSAVNFIILDGEAAFSIRDFVLHSAGVEYQNVRDLRSMFEYLWQRGVSPQVLYHAAVVQGQEQDLSDLRLSAAESWIYLINLLARQPAEIYSLAPRKFEELIAELLARDGFEVELTPSTRDGGRDIIALADSALGKHLYLVECKRYSPQRPVGVSLIRGLYGVVESEKATAGLFVTTSRYTEPALLFQRSVSSRLSLKGYEELCRWLQSKARIKPANTGLQRTLGLAPKRR